MATTVHMQAAPPRPPMDRSSSFDQARSRPSYTTNSRSSSPSVRPQTYAHAASGSHSHSRNNSNASASSYAQPFASSYFPQQQQLYSLPHTQSWSTTALPASAFYPPQMIQPYQQGMYNYQQSGADFAAWANAYHQMVAASMGQGMGPQAGQGMGPPPADFGERRRTNSGPSQSQGYAQFHPYESHPPQHSPPTSHSGKMSSPPQTFHPYKRAPTKAKENVPAGIPRSTSTPSLSTSSAPSTDHQRHSSMDSSSGQTQRPPIAPRRDSNQSDRATPVPAKGTAKAPPPGPTMRAVNSNQQPQPLHTGPIANATNTLPAPRPSPLSQATNASPEPEKVKNGLKSRLKKALDKDAASKKASTTPSVVAKENLTSPSLSAHSVTPPTTPPQASDFPAPTAPFSNPSAMSSDVSIETERAGTGAPSLSEINQSSGKKRSLFRMRNMSTDNISIQSTVSSASMMIRKMGSIGKLARRNSLMGISKIFRDKPKDEDAALPEREAKLSKKEMKKAKKAAKAKGEAAPVAVSRATAEHDRESTPTMEEDDRALAGLSPAAKLARQHTLRSKAEAAQKEAQRLSQISTSSTNSGYSGEPTWDNNTTTRHNGVLPPISSITEEDVVSPSGTIVRVASRQGPTVVHAVPVEHEYDSEDDSSDGETVEDVTMQLAKSRLSDGAADREFREAWGNAWIDKNAVPKKGILKSILSMENLEATASRQRSNSTVDSTLPATRGPMSSPPINPDKMDGLEHHVENLTTSPEAEYGGVFGAFESPIPTPDLHFYQNPVLNTSAPSLSVLSSSKPLTPRALTAPTPAKRRIEWAPECAVYSTYDAGTYDRRGEIATCNRLTPELAMAIKQELNAFKLEMPVHPSSRINTHYFA